MSGRKGRSGRLPRAIELQRSRGKDDALSCVRRRLPEILGVIVEKAEAGDKECAIYCVDRVLGRPRMELDQRVRNEIPIPSPSEILAAYREVERVEAEFMGYPSVEAMRQARLSTSDQICNYEVRLSEAATSPSPALPEGPSTASTTDGLPIPHPRPDNAGFDARGE